VARSDLERQITAIASLGDPVRRGLYLYVAGRGREVGRDEAARALRISRALAAFHLDKLHQHGLLETSYRRLTRRRGPGAGRPAKLYRRADLQLDVSLPRRRYELAGRVLARAIMLEGTSRMRRALQRAAQDLGRDLGAGARGTDTGAACRRSLADALAVLDACGYEPSRTNAHIRLRNCPFAALANEYRPLVCSMNLALLKGVLSGAGARGVKARLDPRPGSCCVLIRTPSRGRR